MKKVHCLICRRDSLVRKIDLDHCLRCGRTPGNSSQGHLSWRMGSRGVECPICRIYHPGRNVGSPSCAKCNKQRERLRIANYMQDSYSSSSEHEFYGWDSDGHLYSDDHLYSDHSFEGLSLNDSEDDLSLDEFYGPMRGMVAEMQNLSINRPAPAAALRSLQRREVVGKKVGEDCVICYQAFKRKEVYLELRCSHCYHESCILQWLDSHDSCPLCRKRLS